MNVSVGIDLVEVGRFRSLLKRKDKGRAFIDKIFSKEEQAYCFSYKDAATHLAGTFAAKEAIQKASGLFSIDPRLLEIRRAKSGKPEAWIRNRRASGCSISISHTMSAACAVALYKK
jgi:holo-[acyl-carrier protein] synthase